MGKTILKTFLGLLLAFSGFYFSFVYVYGIDRGVSIFVLFAGIVLVIVGGFALIYAGSSSESVMRKPKTKPFTENKAGGFSEVLRENNEITSNWQATSSLRDKLKMIQITSEQKEKEKNI